MWASRTSTTPPTGTESGSVAAEGSSPARSRRGRPKLESLREVLPDEEHHGDDDCVRRRRGERLCTRPRLRADVDAVETPIGAGRDDRREGERPQLEGAADNLGPP